MVRVNKNIGKILGLTALILGYIPTYILNSDNVRSEVFRNKSLVCNDAVCDHFLDICKNSPSYSHVIISDLTAALSLPLEKHEETLVAHKNTKEQIETVVAPKNLQKPSLKEIQHGRFKNAKFVRGTIRKSFYADARRLGVPAKVVDSVIGNLSKKVNFCKSLKSGNKFEILFDKNYRLIYCSVEMGKDNSKKVSVYGVEEKSKMVYCFDDGTRVNPAKGDGFAKPLPGQLHVTSHFGIRRHPVNHRLTNHTGVDFKAAYGTPVYAIADGVVTRASIYSGYGHCIEIRHRDSFSSLYGHLSRYAVRIGASVKKGQLIAYSGTSGVSTGPHLHLELARNNHRLNPLSIKMMPASTKIADIDNFSKYKRQLQNAISKVR